MPCPIPRRIALLWTFTLALLLAVAGPAAADPAAESRAVIERQLDAFAADDFDEAYSYAAPSIQRIFPTPQVFEQMVRGGYAMVIAPPEVAFLGAEAIPGGTIAHRLRLVGQDGVAYIARYYLREVDGAWRITGVDIERAPDLAA